MACESVGIANIYTDLTCSSALKMRIAAFLQAGEFQSVLPATWTSQGCVKPGDDDV
jgi:hypothetical protein